MSTHCFLVVQNIHHKHILTCIQLYYLSMCFTKYDRNINSKSVIQFSSSC